MATLESTAAETLVEAPAPVGRSARRWRRSRTRCRRASPPAAPLLVLAGYTLVFAFIARRFFRWE